MADTFHTAVAREWPALRRYAGALARDAQEADDLAQDTMERALKRQEQFAAGTYLRAWLCTIMRSRFDHQQRDAANRTAALTRRPGVMGPTAINASQEDHAELREVNAAMNELSADHLAVLRLCVLDGCSYQETARRLGLPVGTVRSRLARARWQLRRPGADGATD